MGLRSKLFLVFSAIILALLVFTFLFSNNKTITYETKRITQQLQAVQIRFLDRFNNESTHNLKLVKTITSDQKYRSFLQQMRDNYFSFAEEIANDTNADIVLIVDEDIKLRGVSSPAKNTQTTNQQASRAQKFIDMPAVRSVIETILDSGTDHKQVVALGNSLFNSVFVPLKESLQDDYALGVVSVGVKLDDVWVTNLLADDIGNVDVIFHIDGRAAATNIKNRIQLGLLQNALAMETDTGTIGLAGERHIVVRGIFNNAGTPAGYVLSASLDKAMAPFVSLQWQIFAVGLAALFIGLALVLFLTNKIVLPIRMLVQGTGEVMSGNYEYHVENQSKDEVGQLANAFNHMIKGLKEKEQIRALFGKYVHPSIVSDIMKKPDNLEMGGTRKIQTLLFSDIEGFTTISEAMEAEQIVDLLNEFLGTMTEELSAHEGILDKYLGDGIMAFWGEPFTTDNHALLACSAGLAMQTKLGIKAAEWSKRGLPVVRMRIGIATGEVVVGNIGSKHSRDYTCIGDTVNLSSRLEGVNKIYGTGIIIDEDTRTMAGDGVVARELDTVQVRGRESSTRIFELVGLASEVMPQALKRIDRYEEALGHYRSGNFSMAKEAFEQFLRSEPDDTATKVMLEQCRANIECPKEDWTATRILKH